MTDTAEIEPEAPKKSSRLMLILSLVLALVGSGAGFFVIYSGMLFGPELESGSVEEVSPTVTDLPDVGFVKVDPILITFPQGTASRHLRFSAHLEVPSEHLKEVESLMPRVVDVLNSYLRALEVADLEHPAALIKLRSQMLRRIRIVTGAGRVRDLLVSEFVMN